MRNRRYIIYSCFHALIYPRFSQHHTQYQKNIIRNRYTLLFTIHALNYSLSQQVYVFFSQNCNINRLFCVRNYN